MKSLPKELQFDDIGNLISPINFPYEMDKKNMQKILIPHFENVKQKLTNTIGEREKHLKSGRSSLRRDGFSSYDIKENYLNIDFFREFVVLNEELQNLSVSIDQKRKSLMSSNITVLNHLKKVALYLIENPIPIYINIDSVTVPFLEIENNNLYSLKKRIYFCRKHIKDIILKTRFIQEPHLNKSLIHLILKEWNEMVDPFNMYIPETEGYFLFKRFLLSKDEITDRLKDLTLLNFHIKLKEMLEILPKILDVDKNLYPLKYHLAKFLYDITSIQFPLERSVNDENKIFLLRNKKLHELGFPNTFFNQEFLQQTASELFQNPILSGIPSELLSCYFNTFPFDTFVTVSKIHLKMIHVIASITNLSFDAISGSDIILAFWRALFVVSQLPNPRYLISTISHIHSLSLLPSNLSDIFSIINQAMKALLK